MQNTYDNLEKIQRFILRNRGKIRNLQPVQNWRELEPNQIIGIDMLNQIEYITQDGESFFGIDQITQIKNLYNEKIRNLILTKRGEKLFDLNYGSEIYGFLFKTEFKIEDTTYASEYIKSLLKTNFSELFNVNIKVERKEDETQFVYFIYLEYEIPFIGNNTEIIEIIR